ncbi:MAG: hypothetical protein ABIP20_15390 [Chthoniobacteraceae bacterium]
MKRQAYYPSRAADQVLWLENFRNKLTPYQAALALTAAQLAAGIADARWLSYILGTWLPAVRAFAPACTDATNLAMTGNGAALTALPVFTAPALPAGVTATFTGALNRLFALIQTIKDAAGYTEAIGTDLGLVGSQQTAPDLTTVQPVLTATVNGSKVDLGWGWERNSTFLDMCELQVDRADGKGFVPLAFDTTPNYTDSAPFPAALTKWTYRGIYHVNDQRVSLWSADVSAIEGG